MFASVVAAFGAAVMFGASTALMHHGASTAPEGVHGLRALLRHVVKQWRWVLGMVASLTGLGLHALALHHGSISVVQPLVVSGLVFAFIFRSALDRRLPSRRVMGWVVVTASGLALVVVAASATRSTSSADGVAATLVLGLGAAVTALATLAARGDTVDSRRGLLLGIGAGVVFGLIGGTLKATTDAATAGHLLTSWPIYVLLPLGLAAFLLNQQAYHAAPLSRSLPVLSTVNPLVAIGFGMAVFHERPSSGAGPILVELTGLVAVLGGIFFLARSSEVTSAL